MNCTAEDTQQQPERRARAGFTLVEMMVAIVILAVGLLGMASTSAVVTRQTGGSATQTVATQVVANRLEKFRSLSCDRSASGGETTRRISERWTRGATVNRVLFVYDTVSYSVAGSKRSETRAFTITVQCQ